MNDYIALLESLIRTRPVTSAPERVNAATTVMRDYLESRGIFCRTFLAQNHPVTSNSDRPWQRTDAWHRP